MDTERGGGVPHPEPVFSLKRTQQKLSRNDGFINLIAQVYKDMEEKKKVTGWKHITADEVIKEVSPLYP